MNPLHLTFTELGKLYRSKAISPTEVTQSLLEEIEKKDADLNSYTTVTADLALEQARTAESEFASGKDRGPLHGIPINLKDNIITAGISTQVGSPIMKEYIPDQDAYVVPLLRSAGAVMLGKTNMLEFAYGETNTVMGEVSNPWNLAHTVSGSSSGSAASVARGLSYGTLGTDTAGSIRIPSSYCGLVGLKPTYGLVNCEGVIPLGWSLDHMGPMTRSVHDNAAILGAISEFDYNSFLKTDTKIKNLRIGVVRMGVEVSDEVRSAVTSVVNELQKNGTSVQFDLSTAFLDDSSRILMGLLLPEASAAHEDFILEHAEKYHPVIRERLEIGLMIPAVDYIRAQRFRKRIIHDADLLMADYDVLITPTTTTPAPRKEGEIDLTNITRFTCPFNVTGLPALSLPCAISTSGLPFGLQIVGKPFTESIMYKVALAVEEITGLSGLVAGGNKVMRAEI
jgi:aspartyl-tRNA(Asn)/glutamyl-tRNA(Gln) amidotransferase subunit A